MINVIFNILLLTNIYQQEWFIISAISYCKLLVCIHSVDIFTFYASNVDMNKNINFFFKSQKVNLPFGIWNLKAPSQIIMHFSLKLWIILKYCYTLNRVFKDRWPFVQNPQHNFSGMRPLILGLKGR